MQEIQLGGQAMPEPASVKKVNWIGISKGVKKMRQERDEMYGLSQYIVYCWWWT